MAITVVQVSALSTSGAPTLSGVTAGNTLVLIAVCGYGNTSPDITATGYTVAGNTGLVGTSGGTAESAAVLYQSNAPAGSAAPSITGAAGSYATSAILMEVSGLAASPVDLDVVGAVQTVSAGGGNYTIPLTGTAAQSGELIVSVQTTGYGNSTSVFNTPSGYTSIANNPGDLSSFLAVMGAAYQIASGTAIDGTQSGSYPSGADTGYFGGVLVSFKAAGTSGNTGSGAITEGLDLFAAASAVTLPSASGALIEGLDTLAASAAVALPSASGAITEGLDAFAAAAASTVAGSAALTEGHDATAAQAAPLVAGSGAITEGLDLLAATAAALAQGSATITERGDILVARGTVIAGVAGEGDIFEGVDAFVGVAQAIAGATGAIAEGRDTSTAAAAVTLPSASGAMREGSDTLLAAAAVTYPQAHGTILEGADRIAGSSAVVLPTATASILEGLDTFAGAAAVYAGVFGYGHITETADAFQATAAATSHSYPFDGRYYAALPIRYFYGPLIYNSVKTRYFYSPLPVRYFHALCNPNMTARLDTKDPRETVVITLDATNDLLSTETLTTITATSITVATGADPGPALQLTDQQVNPTAITLGVNTIAIGKAVQAVCTSGLNAVTYLIAITAETTNPDKVLTLKAFLPVSAS